MEEEQRPPMRPNYPFQKQRESDRGGANIDLIGDDLLHNVLSRLPALSFAYASCVSRSWNLVSARVLSRPRLVSALSSNPDLTAALTEIFYKVLAQPIRPHFAIASVGRFRSLQAAHHFITAQLGSTTPVITHGPHGIIGRDALTDELKEVQWEVTEDDDHTDLIQPPNTNSAIMLTIGYLPGLKVDAIPLMRSREEPCFADVDQFVTDIRDYTNSISGCTSPAGIVLFAGYGTDMQPVLEKIDYAMSPSTVIVGDGGGCEFHYRRNYQMNSAMSQGFTPAAVALVFMRVRDKPQGIGETQFHITLSAGTSPIGPTFKALSVKDKRDDNSTWLTARRAGVRENLDGHAILNHIYDELGDRVQDPAFFIGVTKRRKCSIGKDKVRWITSRAFHEVLGADDEHLYVGQGGIRTGDSFCFYYSDINIASSSCSNVSNYLKLMKEDDGSNNPTANGSNKDVFGCIIFSCCGRGQSFFGQSNMDSSPFLDNFPGVTLAGSFCGGEIARGDMSGCNYNHININSQESQEQQASVRCCLHVFSSVYFIMSYTPPVLP